MTATTVDRFHGWIAGLGTAAGLRVVVGHWRDSPLGAFTDVMLEFPGEHRVLLAPSEAVAEFVSGTYGFDEVRIVAFRVATATGDGRHHRVEAGPLELNFRTGGRPPLGLLLRAVPRRLATDPRWVSLIDALARRVLPGVRTRGSAGNGREEFYAALDVHRVAGAEVRWAGIDQGPLAPVDPPVRFGFGSTPRTPSLVEVVTLVRTRAAGGAAPA